MPKISLPDSYKFRRVFFDRCSLWRKRRWNSLYGHFSRKERVRARIDQSESESAPINGLQSAGWQHWPRSGRMSLKKCVFGCEGKITLFSFPKQPTVTWTVDIVCFSGAAMEFLKCFVDERFINKAQFDAGFAHRLILKDGVVPAIKDPGHDSELQMVSETASNVCVLLAIGASACHSLAPPTRHASRSSAFFGENCKSVSFFYKYDKTKDFLEIWRMQYYTIGTQD